MGILSSPRRRRRLLIATMFVAPIVPLVYLGVHYSTPGNPGAPTGPAVALPGYEQPEPAPFTKDKQQQVSRVLKGFISTAVVRRNVGRSWDLAAPSLKEGFTRRQWNRGDLPVVPYPAANKGLGRWSFVQYSYTDTVGLEVFLFPKPGSGYSALTADVELVKGNDGRWRVDYWMPKKFHGPPAVSAEAKAKAKPKRPVHAKAAGKRSAPERRAAPALPEPPTPSRLWWIVPIALVSFIVLAPISIIAGIWYRNRRAEREYFRSSGRA